MTAPAPDARRLAERVAALPVAIETFTVTLGGSALSGWFAGDTRPTARLTVKGGGEEGEGECVAWTAAEQRRFGARCSTIVPGVPTTIGELHRALAGSEAYHAAAVEAAALDLALRQAGTSLFALAGREPRPVAFCRSLGREEIALAGGPAEAARSALAADPRARLKLDVAPEGWSDDAWRAVAAAGSVVVADFKQEGRIEQVAAAHRALPDAWLEDPPPPALDPAAAWRGRISVDGYADGPDALAALPLSPAAVNVKAARVGGPLSALHLFDAAARVAAAVYVGGMFELGPGRRQAWVLASLFCPDAWNDVAPLAGGATLTAEGRIAVEDRPGFGAAATRPA